MYDSDLTEEQWSLIAHHFARKDNRGAQSTHDKHTIVNAILYIIRTGCQWRLLPKDFPPWKTVYGHYDVWNRRGVWEAALDDMNQLHRKKSKSPTPSYGIVDSQSVKTLLASDQRGYDGGKKVKGRKRHLVVDTMGNLIQVSVHAANSHDTQSGGAVMKAAAQKYATLEAFSGDEGYNGTAVDFVEKTLEKTLNIAKKIKDTFTVLPIRWIVERTVAWLGNHRRLSKDYERLTRSAENMVRIARLRITIRKIA